MADSWEDNDDFDVPPIAKPDKEIAWDDEEEFEPAPLVSHGDAPKLSKEKEDKLAREKEAARLTAIEAALDEAETEGEKRMRERQRVEDADHELAEELYNGSGGASHGTKTITVQSIDGYALKNLKDHLILAHDVADAFEKKKSKANFRTKCVKELLKKIEESLTSEDCDEIIGLCTATKLAIEKAKKQPLAKKVVAPKTKSKKELAAEKAAHDELFGGFVENEYAAYEEQFDDFM